MIGDETIATVKTMTFEDLIRSIDDNVKAIAAGVYPECVWTGLHVMMPTRLPDEFLNEWAHKGTWALNTLSSQPKLMPITITKTTILSSMELATLQHNVRSVLFDAIDRIDSMREVVEIIDTLHLRIENDKMVVAVNILTFIVARKMWHLFPAEGKTPRSNVEHYSFGEAIAELLSEPKFEGITFKTDPDDLSTDVVLSRLEVAKIFREQQAKTHQDIIRKEAGYYAFLGRLPSPQKKSPPFREGLLSLITDMREPNTTAIASWLRQIKKGLSTPHFAVTDPWAIANAINAAAPPSRSVQIDLATPPQV